ncbi:Retrotransposon gag protein [Popillia japonica]|uniref:Retrotransposon gag protein n=1 Tax=Popillia japonica TaxID=7064 RepID=A0AAW1LA93_POPJA
MEWNDLHKYIFAKKSLRGLAKLYIQGEAGLNSWRSLKRALLKEFSTKINSVKLHETLRTRQIKKGESAQEYLLVMKEIASRGSIDDESLIQYVINGIADDDPNKIVLS